MLTVMIIPFPADEFFQYWVVDNVRKVALVGQNRFGGNIARDLPLFQ